ncbi:MAG: outer membrane protein OmpK, partial [Shewanella sp.]
DLSGYAVVLNAKYPFELLGFKNSLSLNYEAQIDRDKAHQALFSYDSYGHQIITTLQTNLTDSVFSKIYVTHYDSWGSQYNDGIEYGVSVGYQF